MVPGGLAGQDRREWNSRKIPARLGPGPSPRAPYEKRRLHLGLRCVRRQVRRCLSVLRPQRRKNGGGGRALRRHGGQRDPGQERAADHSRGGESPDHRGLVRAGRGADRGRARHRQGVRQPRQKGGRRPAPRGLTAHRGLLQRHGLVHGERAHRQHRLAGRPVQGHHLELHRQPSGQALRCHQDVRRRHQGLGGQHHPPQRGLRQDDPFHGISGQAHLVSLLVGHLPGGDPQHRGHVPLPDQGPAALHGLAGLFPALRPDPDRDPARHEETAPFHHLGHRGGRDQHVTRTTSSRTPLTSSVGSSRVRTPRFHPRSFPSASPPWPPWSRPSRSSARRCP